MIKNGIATAHVGRLGATLLGVYLIAIGIVPYLPAMGISVLVSVLAVATGVVILIGR